MDHRPWTTNKPTKNENQPKTKRQTMVARDLC